MSEQILDLAVEDLTAYDWHPCEITSHHDPEWQDQHGGDGKYVVIFTHRCGVEVNGTGPVVVCGPYVETWPPHMWGTCASCGCFVRRGDMFRVVGPVGS